MQIKIFNIPMSDTGEMESELNRFLSGYKILEIEQHFFQNAKGGYWSFCIRHLSTTKQSTSGGIRPKVDYRTVLSEPEFGVFSRLREIRKLLAQDDGVPAYAVFTDEELSGISQLEELSEIGLKSIPGIGEKKLLRYGKNLLKMYNSKTGVS